MQKKQISRRNFLNLSATLACTAAMQVTPAKLLAAKLENKAKQLPLLRGFEPEVSSIWVNNNEETSLKDIKTLVESATDFSWLSKGDTVLIKLALNSGNKFPATSDPFVLDSIINILKEKGAGEIIVCDQSGVEHVQFSKNVKRGSSRKLCEESGLLKVIAANDITPVFFEEEGLDAFFKSYPEGTHHWKDPLLIPKAVKKADHIIYLPRVSSHVLADVTAGFKIGVGFLGDESRHDLHRNGKYFYEMYEEINDIPEIRNKLRLTITSGRKVLSTFGPDQGHVSTPDHGLIMASTDLLAAELLSYAWLQWNREFNMAYIAKNITGQITKFRSGINKGLVWKMWENDQKEETTSIPMFIPGNIYDHPSIYNYMKRKGGRPQKIAWESLNQNPDMSVTEYLERQINGTGGTRLFSKTEEKTDGIVGNLQGKRKRSLS